jgi:hypothetical protein
MITLAFLYIGSALLVGLMVILLYVARYQWENRRPVVIAMVLTGMLMVMFASGIFLTLVSGPRLDLAAPVKTNPGQGNAYVSIMITNRGDVVARDCTGEITIDGITKLPMKLVWAGGSDSQNIVSGGGNGQLYLLVADPDKVPVRVIPYYSGALTPPRTDDPVLLKAGDYTLKLAIRSENTGPLFIEYLLHVGQKWDELSCRVK